LFFSHWGQVGVLSDASEKLKKSMLISLSQSEQ